MEWSGEERQVRQAGSHCRAIFLSAAQRIQATQPWPEAASVCLRLVKLRGAQHGWWKEKREEQNQPTAPRER